MNAYLTPYYNPYLAMINGYNPAFSSYPYVCGPNPYFSPPLVSYNPYLARVGGYLGPYMGSYLSPYAGYLGYP